MSEKDYDFIVGFTLFNPRDLKQDLDILII